MELVQRYLQMIKTFLPKGEQDDIIAELHDTLMSRLEERESVLQRALTDSEVAAEIKAFGHPMQVASRYFPQQYLIGPQVFPYWWFVAKIGLIGLLLAHATIALIAALHSDQVTQAIIQSVMQAISQSLFSFIGTASFWLSFITLLFWGLDRVQIKWRLLQNWQPENLPKLSDIRAADEKLLRIKRSDTLFDIVVSVLFLLVWTGALSFPTFFWHHGESLHFVLAEIWQKFFWLIVALGVVDVALSLTNLLFPYWTRPRLLVRLLCSLLTLGVIAVISQTDVLVLWQGDHSASVERIYHNVNTSVRYMLYGVGFITIGVVINDIRRWFKCK